jgi:potassium efflux system protein
MLRRAAVRRARQRAQELQKHQAQQAEGLETPPAASVQEQEIDLGRINTQTRRMLRFVALAGLIVGVYVIWIDALPALGIFDEVRLWNTTATVSETVTTPEGETTTESVERVVPVSLADLLAAALVLIITVAAARNVPGLLEFTILQRVQLDVGVRYAAKTIVLYLIVVVGVVFTFGLVGVSWGSVQWLLAAMTVGLGFGLQEIFANFVSGLIILFERPVRIGDTITVGETHGTVTRIRIRATTITDWDRKELIVPNKEFITSRMVNWTLSDKVLRVVLPVGIAYGSDTRKAEEILHRVAQEHPLVLDDPKPIILFMDFGDSALGFEARIYIAGIEHYLRVRHEMNMRIDEEFRKADITIAFPQRDVHLDSLTPVQVQLVEGRGLADVPPGAAPPPADHA